MRFANRCIVAVIFVGFLASCTLLPLRPDSGGPGEEVAAGTPGSSEQDVAGSGRQRESPSTPETPEAAVTRPRPVARGDQSAVRIPVAMTISDQTTLEEAWAAIHANKLAAPLLPNIDFASELVILLVLGERPTAGYGVRAATVTQGPRSISVEVDVTFPDPDSMVAAVLTSPFEFTAIPATQLPVMFTGDDVRDGFDEE